MLLGRLLPRICSAQLPNVSSKHGAAALPRLESSVDSSVALGFEKPEDYANRQNRLKLVIRPRPEDGWYVMKPNGLLKSYLQVSCFPSLWKNRFIL